MSTQIWLLLLLILVVFVIALARRKKSRRQHARIDDPFSPNDSNIHSLTDFAGRTIKYQNPIEDSDVYENLEDDTAKNAEIYEEGRDGEL